MSGRGIPKLDFTRLDGLDQEGSLGNVASSGVAAGKHVRPPSSFHHTKQTGHSVGVSGASGRNRKQEVGSREQLDKLKRSAAIANGYLRDSMQRNRTVENSEISSEESSNELGRVVDDVPMTARSHAQQIMLLAAGEVHVIAIRSRFVRGAIAMAAHGILLGIVVGAMQHQYGRIPSTVQPGAVGSSALSMLTAAIAVSVTCAGLVLVGVLTRASPGYRMAGALLLTCMSIVTMVALFAGIAAADALHRQNQERGAFRGEWRNLKVQLGFSCFFSFSCMLWTGVYVVAALSAWGEGWSELGEHAWVAVESREQRRCQRMLGELKVSCMGEAATGAVSKVTRRRRRRKKRGRMGGKGGRGRGRDGARGRNGARGRDDSREELVGGGSGSEDGSNWSDRGQGEVWEQNVLEDGDVDGGSGSGSGDSDGTGSDDSNSGDESYSDKELSSDEDLEMGRGGRAGRGEQVQGKRGKTRSAARGGMELAVGDSNGSGEFEDEDSGADASGTGSIAALGVGGYDKEEEEEDEDENQFGTSRPTARMEAGAALTRSTHHAAFGRRHGAANQQHSVDDPSVPPALRQQTGGRRDLARARGAAATSTIRPSDIPVLFSPRADRAAGVGPIPSRAALQAVSSRAPAGSTGRALLMRGAGGHAARPSLSVGSAAAPTADGSRRAPQGAAVGSVVRPTTPEDSPPASPTCALPGGAAGSAASPPQATGNGDRPRSRPSGGASPPEPSLGPLSAESDLMGSCLDSPTQFADAWSQAEAAGQFQCQVVRPFQADALGLHVRGKGFVLGPSASAASAASIPGSVGAELWFAATRRVVKGSADAAAAGCGLEDGLGVLFLCRLRVWQGRVKPGAGPADLRGAVGSAVVSAAEDGRGSGLFEGASGKGGAGPTPVERGSFEAPCVLAAAIRLCVVRETLERGGDIQVVGKSSHGLDLGSCASGFVRQLRLREVLSVEEDGTTGK